MQKHLIIANWKMYKTESEALSFLEKLLPLLQKSEDLVWIAPPFTLISALAKKADQVGELFVIGAQNMNDATEGAFTGEVSAKMVVDAGAKFVILGHSERRTHFQESSAFINKKVLRALQDSLDVVLCVGETFDEKETGEADTALEKQLIESLAGVLPDQMEKVYIAYEPLWAIGTGHVATSEVIEEKADFIKQVLEKMGLDTPKILYGGSVTPENIDSLRKINKIVGFLVGGASLKPDLFGRIITTNP